MAKTKTKARAPAESKGNLAVRIIAAVIVLVVLAALCAGIIITYKHTNGFAQGFQTFYVEVNGKRYYENDAICLKKHGSTTFTCGYMLKGSEDVNERFTYSITSTATDETAFKYSVDGIETTFKVGEDYTKYFNVTTAANGFTIANEEDTPFTVLQRKYPGTKITGQQPDPQISYFILTVTAEDGKQTVSFALTFEHVEIGLDPGQIIF